MNTRKVLAAILVITLAAGLAGCTGSRTQVVTWWTLPDRVGAEALAQSCSDVADGYRIEVRELPADLGQRRADLIRRLSVNDRDVDLITLDSAITAEFSAAGYLAPVPDDLRNTIGLVSSAVDGATYRGRLVAVPWWVDPFVLWYRGAAAERAGIDTSKPVSWRGLLSGANRVRASVQFDDMDGTGTSDWVRGLVAEAGGSVIDGPGRTATVGLNTQAGRAAAGVVQYYAASGLGVGPSPAAIPEFAGSRGAFLIARASVRSVTGLATVATDMKPLPYPQVSGRSTGPVASANLAVVKASESRKAAFDAVRCLTSVKSEQNVMVNSGAGAARESVYTLRPVVQAVPFSGVLLTAAKSGRNAPASPYWHDAQRAIESTWMPLAAVRVATTPAASSRAVANAVGGGL